MNIDEIIRNTSGKQQIELTELTINNLLKGNGINHRIAIYDGYFVLKTDNGIEVHLEYNTHEIDLMDNNASLTLRVLRVKPFYYMYSLPLIGKMFPYLQYRKDSDNLKLITCNLNLIPGMRDKLTLYKQYLHNIQVKGVACRDRKIIIELKQQCRKEDTYHVFQNTVQKEETAARI